MEPRELNKIIDDILPTLKDNDISGAWVFGSFARGEQSETSDLDILVRFSCEKGLFDVIHLENELCDRIGRKVDILTEGADLHPEVQKTIHADLTKIL